MPELIANRYTIQSELGRGGFATVYRALDTRLNREIALKILKPALTDDPHFLELFHREAQIAAGLKHPNIVTIYDTGDFESRLFISMELLNGLDLRRTIERDGALPLPLAVSIIEQIASALEYAHKRGIIHRDVKAANIIVDEVGHATLTDFGLVRALESSTYGSSLSMSGGFVGSVEYIPPEVVEGQPVTAQSDLYSLGVVAYEMITGQVPFKADKPIAVAYMHANKPPRDPRELRADLPTGMSAVILKTLAKKPNERHANVMAFAAALREELDRPAKQEAEERERRQSEAVVIAARLRQETEERRRENEESERKQTAALAAQRKHEVEEQAQREADAAPAVIPGGDTNRPVTKTPWGVIIGAVGIIGALIVIALLSSGKAAAPAPTLTVAPTITVAPIPTSTLLPTATTTPNPIITPQPTNTPEPTVTHTPLPSLTFTLAAISTPTLPSARANAPTQQRSPAATATSPIMVPNLDTPDAGGTKPQITGVEIIASNPQELRLKILHSLPTSDYYVRLSIPDSPLSPCANGDNCSAVIRETASYKASDGSGSYGRLALDNLFCKAGPFKTHSLQVELRRWTSEIMGGILEASRVFPIDITWCSSH